MNNWMDLNETRRKQSLDVHLQLIRYWSLSISIWPPQPADFKKYKNGRSSLTFVDIELKFAGIVSGVFVSSTQSCVVSARFLP